MGDEAILYMNGVFKPLSEAHVSVLDQGFLLGDGVFDVVSAWRGTLFRLDDHLDALRDVERALFGDDACTPVASPGDLDPQSNDRFPDVCAAQIDLAVTALACGSTPVACMRSRETHERGLQETLHANTKLAICCCARAHAHLHNACLRACARRLVMGD